MFVQVNGCTRERLREGDECVSESRRMRKRERERDAKNFRSRMLQMRQLTRDVSASDKIRGLLLSLTYAKRSLRIRRE